MRASAAAGLAACQLMLCWSHAGVSSSTLQLLVAGKSLWHLSVGHCQISTIATPSISARHSHDLLLVRNTRHVHVDVPHLHLPPYRAPLTQCHCWQLLCKLRATLIRTRTYRHGPALYLCVCISHEVIQVRMHVTCTAQQVMCTQDALETYWCYCCCVGSCVVRGVHLLSAGCMRLCCCCTALLPRLLQAQHEQDRYLTGW